MGGSLPPARVAIPSASTSSSSIQRGLSFVHHNKSECSIGSDHMCSQPFGWDEPFLSRLLSQEELSLPVVRLGQALSLLAIRLGQAPSSLCRLAEMNLSLSAARLGRAFSLGHSIEIAFFSLSSTQLGSAFFSRLFNWDELYLSRPLGGDEHFLSRLFGRDEPLLLLVV